MPRTRSAIWICASVLVFGIYAARAHAQTGPPNQEAATGSGGQQFIPSRTLEFNPVESGPDFALPAITTDYPHCLSGGSLVVHAVDWDAVKKTPKGTIPKYNRIVTIVQGRKMLTLSSSGISDLTDFNVHDIFPADSGIYFLVQGAKEKPGERGPGKSPAGIEWNSYRSFVARFELDGTYKGATELGTECDLTRPGHCDLAHLAVFPSGDMLATEPDPLTSSLRVLYLKSSGEVVKRIDVPAGRRPVEWGDASSNPELQQAARVFLSSVYFTAVDKNIVVWRANSNDPVVEVSDGGGVREVPLQVPDGYRFADMVASNDRWVVHFRTENTPPTARMSQDTDAYYEVRPQDGSLAAKLVQTGDAPLSIACKSSGTYTSFKMNNAGKMVLLQAK